MHVLCFIISRSSAKCTLALPSLRFKETDEAGSENTSSYSWILILGQCLESLGNDQLISLIRHTDKFLHELFLILTIYEPAAEWNKLVKTR